MSLARDQTSGTLLPHVLVSGRRQHHERPRRARVAHAGARQPRTHKPPRTWQPTREQAVGRTGARPWSHERPRSRAIVRAALARVGEDAPLGAPPARDARRHSAPNPRPAQRCAPRTSSWPHRRRPEHGAHNTSAIDRTDWRAAREPTTPVSDRWSLTPGIGCRVPAR
jgi:hypothetical protein